jgi:hemoglobin-like flavoprotein
MYRLAVLLGLVAVCVASTPIDHCCSADDRAIVLKQWKSLWMDVESSKMKIAFGRRILLKVVEQHPEAKALFTAVNIDKPESGEFAAHCMRILNALDMCINMLDNPEALDEALDHLAEQHRVRTGVKREYFKTFGTLLLKYGLPRVLDDYDAMSWKSCFTGLFSKVASKLQA